MRGIKTMTQFWLLAWDFGRAYHNHQQFHHLTFQRAISHLLNQSHTALLHRRALCFHGFTPKHLHTNKQTTINYQQHERQSGASWIILLVSQWFWTYIYIYIILYCYCFVPGRFPILMCQNNNCHGIYKLHDIGTCWELWKPSEAMQGFSSRQIPTLGLERRQDSFWKTAPSTIIPYNTLIERSSLKQQIKVFFLFLSSLQKRVSSKYHRNPHRSCPW